MTIFDLAQRFVGLTEISGPQHEHFIQWCFTLCGLPNDTPDETPWCAAFLNGLAWLLRLPRSKSAAARSWAKVGIPVVRLSDAVLGDVVILNRGGTADVNAAGPGHVGLFAGVEGDHVILLGGNQSNRVSLTHFKISDILAIRRLA